MKVLVRPSELHGLGCFATKNIVKGETIGLYEGLVMELKPGQVQPSPHFLYLHDEDYTACKTCKRDEINFGILGTGLLRHINSPGDTERKANVDMCHAFVVAIEDIAAGEELLMDYEFDGDEEWTE